jgi:hypothetical protein
MFVDYTPMDAMIYLSATAPQRVRELRANNIYPFFIKLLRKPFENWVVEVVGIEEDGSFTSVIDSVPQVVDDQRFNKLASQLKEFLAAVYSDIAEQSVEAVKPIVISEEKEWPSKEKK